MAVWLRPAAETWRWAARSGARRASHPFSLWITLSRNPLRTLPMMLATLVASLGVASVVALADSVVHTAVAPNDFLRDAVMVRADASQLDSMTSYLRSQSTPPIVTRLGPPTFVRGRLFQLETWFPVLVVPDSEAGALVARYGDRIAAGRLPSANALEVALPTAFAKSRKVSIGDVVGGPHDFTPIPLRIVGLVEGPRWIGVASASGVSAFTGPSSEGVLIYDEDANRLSGLERSLRERYGTGIDIRHWTPRVDGGADETTGDLQLMLSFIMAVNATVLSLIGGLLALQYFRQRQGEFVLLSILGRTKIDLAKRLVMEVAVVVGVGWLGGLIATQLLLLILGHFVLADRAVILDFVTPGTLLQTFPLAFVTIAVSSAVTLASLYRFDPITRLQARP